ncbi:MAG: FHA domain-containing protein [Phycisphaerales bacterium JB063]
MIALQIHITAGPQAGTRLQLTQSPASFGRAPENTLVLDLSTVSRNHGELRYEDDAWWLYNHSQNGTKVGRKRVTKKPRELADGASITIGDEEVFRIHYAGETASPAAPAAASQSAGETPDAQQPEQPAPGTGARGRSKLWLMLAVWFGLVLGVFMILFAVLDKGSPDDAPTNSNQIVQFESADDVRQILKQPVQRGTADEYRHDENLSKARQNYNNEPRTRHLYEAYRYYRLAVKHLPANQDLGPEDQQRYEVVLDELSELVFKRYEDARILNAQGAQEDALVEIDQLIQFFPARNREDAAEQELYEMILRLRGRAARGAGR